LLTTLKEPKVFASLEKTFAVTVRGGGTKLEATPTVSVVDCDNLMHE